MTGSRPQHRDVPGQCGPRRAFLDRSSLRNGGEATSGAERGTGGAESGAKAIWDSCAASEPPASLSAPVLLGGRAYVEGGKSCRLSVRAERTAAEAPRGTLLPGVGRSRWPQRPRRGGAPPLGGRRRRRQRRGASTGSASGRGGAAAGLSVLCGGAAGSSAAQWACTRRRPRGTQKPSFPDPRARWQPAKSRHCH